MWIGIDGCTEGWVLVLHNGVCWSAMLVDTLNACCDLLLQAELIFIDMPIGLAEDSSDGSRPCDKQARSLLKHRKSSIFSPPVRSTLTYSSYYEALAHQRSVTGKGFSVQAWNIVPKIRELDLFLRESFTAGLEKVWESHPELCFQQVCGAVTIAASKRTEDGLASRLSAVKQSDSALFEMLISHEFMKKKKLKQDLIDAAILAYTARISNHRNSLFLPEQPDFDECHLSRQIRTVVALSEKIG